MNDSGAGNRHPVDCIVPVAGLSSRMGRWKPAVNWHGTPMVRHVVERCLEWCTSVVVVTGFRGQEIRGLLEDLDRVRFVRNDNYRSGMFSSIVCGMKHVGSDSFLVAMADMPRIPDAAFAAVLAEPCETWARPVYGERRLPGHPVRINSTLIPEFLKLPPESGEMRTVLKRYRGLRVPIEDPGVVFDADTPEDLNRRL